MNFRIGDVVHRPDFVEAKPMYFGGITHDGLYMLLCESSYRRLCNRNFPWAFSSTQPEDVELITSNGRRVLTEICNEI